ncbi:MAG: chemotaxis protein CheW [Rhodospirillaceae bacterium]
MSDNLPAVTGEMPAKAPGARDVVVPGSADLYLTLELSGGLFALPVSDVSEIFVADRIFTVPLSPAEIAGALNLRGRVVTIIDLACLLRIDQRGTRPEKAENRSIAVQDLGSTYGLLVGRVADVVDLGALPRHKVPGTVQPIWRQVASDVYSLEKQLLICLDKRAFFAEINRLFARLPVHAAASAQAA